MPGLLVFSLLDSQERGSEEILQSWGEGPRPRVGIELSRWDDGACSGASSHDPQAEQLPILIRGGHKTLEKVNILNKLS